MCVAYFQSHWSVGPTSWPRYLPSQHSMRLNSPTWQSRKIFKSEEYLVPTVAILVAARVALTLHHTPRHQVLAAVRDPVAGDMLVIQGVQQMFNNTHEVHDLGFAFLRSKVKHRFYSLMHALPLQNSYL